jgi:glutamate 5-kinase
VILTDQAGLYSSDPRSDPAARLIALADAGDADLERMAGAAASPLSRGGMIAKVLAAKRAARSGADTVIAWGREPDVLLRLARGEAIGTRLRARTAKLTARKQWMADHLQLRGAVTIDAGASASYSARARVCCRWAWWRLKVNARGDVIAVRGPNGWRRAASTTLRVNRA